MFLLKSNLKTTRGARLSRPRTKKYIVIFTLVTTLTTILLTNQPTGVEALWLFQQAGGGDQAASSAGTTGDLAQQAEQAQQQVAATQEALATAIADTKGAKGQESQAVGGGYFSGNYGSTLLSIAGIQPSSIASLLNTVGDTGFRYFNIQDQCRNRAACDLGFMLFKKLSFVHNWLIRTSVRTLTDMNNIYTQSWMEGMLGRNCTSVYATCRESPLEGIMNLAMLQHLASSATSSSSNSRR